MAAPKGSEYPNFRRPWSKSSTEIQLNICGSIFGLDKALLAPKSAKIANLLQENGHVDLSLQLCDIPADQESMELIARFCQGFEISLSIENIVRVVCVADYLGMTDTQFPNNLLNKAVSFFEQHVMPSWNNSIKALKCAENVFEPAIRLGLVDYCVHSIVSKAVDDPRLLGEPVVVITSDDDEDDDEHGSVGEYRYKPNARRKLFDLVWKSEDLTSLSLELYAHIINAMVKRGVPKEYTAANLNQYAKTWMLSCDKLGDEMPINTRNHHKETVETLVKVMDGQGDVFPCAFLSEMLRFAIVLYANDECRKALELKIGLQLHRASVRDLFIPSQGYANNEKYDTESLKRILLYFCNHGNPDVVAISRVADLMDDFLADISSDIDLKMTTFLAVADMSVALSKGTPRSMDGIYKGITIYLDKHRHLTESERENLCKILDCNKLSSEACEHAGQNKRLPLRVVVQVLFVSQLRLRESIPKQVRRPVRMEEEEEEGLRMSCSEEDDGRTEMEKMGNKVFELEREYQGMRREMERGKRHKFSMWREVKRKFGCGTSMHECNCQVKKKKKVHPR